MFAIRCVLRNFEAYFDVALRPEIVDLADWISIRTAPANLLRSDSHSAERTWLRNGETDV
jgi:hypothetical protein